MDIIFFGNSEFSIPSVQAISNSSHRLSAVVTLEDRMAGRGRKATPTPVKAWADGHPVTILTMDGLGWDGLVEETRGVQWDIGVVVSFGKIIPDYLLERPEKGFVNLHPSLLPRYRGPAPIQRAIMDGANLTGVTTIRMSQGIDDGPILLHKEAQILEDDTTGSLSRRLSRVGADVLIATLDGIQKGEIVPSPQDGGKATYAPPINKEECNIDWERPGEWICNLIRALNPNPGAHTFFRGKRVKIWRCRITEVPSEDSPGTLMSLGKEGLLVCTGTDCVQIDRVQMEDRDRMSAGEFSRGQRILVGEKFTRQG